MGICLNKQTLMYKVLVPSIITPIPILMDLWRLGTHLCVRGWLSVKNKESYTFSKRRITVKGSSIALALQSSNRV